VDSSCVRHVVWSGLVVPTATTAQKDHTQNRFMLPSCADFAMKLFQYICLPIILSMCDTI